MVLVILDPEIIERVVEQRCWSTLQLQPRQRVWSARQLQLYLRQMIEIQMAVASGPDELSGQQITLLRNHVREQCVRGYIERHTQKSVGAALVQLAGQCSIDHIKLEQCVARQQRHAGQL